MTSEDLNKKGNTPALNGLVLAGGKSMRMGSDKSIINWHGKEQRYYMADMFGAICSNVYISCRGEQKEGIDPQYKTIADNYEGAGPLIGILSAFKAYPYTAWLVVACDLPLLDLATLKYLIQYRITDGIATTFKSPFDGLPEPLITIWEPAAFPVLMQHIADGFKCPRKALIRNESLVKIIEAPLPDKLMNVNTPEDAIRVKQILGID